MEDVLYIPTAECFEPLLEPARYKGAHGGRGSGKSHYFAGRLIELCVLIPGLHAVCIREIQKSLDQSVKKLLEIKIEEFELGGSFIVQHDKIITPGNGQIIFTGMQNHTADSIKSLEGYDIAWVEEAQTLSQHSLGLLRPTIRSEGRHAEILPQSEIWFSWNPNDETDPVDAFLVANKPDNAIVVEANFNDNPWFPEVLRVEMEYDRKHDPDKYRHVWCGEYRTISQARVFNNWKIEEFDSPSGGIYRLGADFGFANDPTVLIRARLEGKRLYIDYEAYMVNCEIDQTGDLFDMIPDSRKWFITAESARPETISYLKRHGYPRIKKSVKGKGSIKEGIEWLKSYDLIVHPRCDHTAYELKHYSYKVDPLTEKVLPILEDADNHVIDALRYACEGVRWAENKTSSSAPTIKPWRPADPGLGLIG